MTPVQGPVRHPNPQSVDDLARRQVIWEILCSPHGKIEKGCTRQGDDAGLEQQGDHPLAPAMGIMNGLRLSAVIWGVIFLGVVLMR